MSVNIQTITDIRKLIKAELSPLYPETEIGSLSDIIIMTVLGAGRLHHLSVRDMIVPGDKTERIKEIIAELKKGRPIQYILGETIFYNCNIKVNEYTLIPRQETEELVDLILKENRDYSGDIIDIGTGSGCIAIALAKNLIGSHVTAIDISAEALEIAKQNSIDNAVTVSFLKADILVPDKIQWKPAGIVVSNPPYVRESEKSLMHKNVLENEPHSALFVPDNDPLMYYKAILRAAGTILKPAGRIYFEVNESFGAEVVSLTRKFGLENAIIIKDLNGRDRFVKAVKNGK
jgi:release factor glutamine methyltransferase